MDQSDSTTTNKQATIPVNTIVEYEGGGYDGCIWEYNYAYIDKDGEFHDILSTGCRGCEDREALDKFVTDPHNIAYKNFTFYTLDSVEVRDRFADECCIRGVLCCGQYLAEHIIEDVALTVRCSECGERADASDATGENYAGCGGVMIEAKSVICESCHSVGSCTYCGEYVGKEYMADPETTDNGYCKWCEETHGSGKPSEDSSS